VRPFQRFAALNGPVFQAGPAIAGNPDFKAASSREFAALKKTRPEEVAEWLI
jgi:hypothetical protein